MLSKNLFFGFTNKVILLTGSEGKLGKEIKKTFIDMGAKVYGIDIKKNSKYENFKANISNGKSVDRIINKIIKLEGRIDVIINNAGVSIYSPMEQRTSKEIDFTLNVNVKGLINVIKSYFNIHKKKKLKSCKIINISSIYGIVAPDIRIYSKNDNINSEIYGASKAAVIQLTKYYATLFGKNNILVNCISPGGIKDKNHSKFFTSQYKKRVPLNRLAFEKDIMGAIIYFSSDSCSYTTGQNLVIDGGLSSW
jgi:NAD(P)-dependent dehydrogenase (short-subunit alcohol dehydrogenase family)